MTTSGTEVIPTEKTAGPWIVHYGEAVKIKDANGYTVASLSQIHLHGRRSKNEVEKTAQFIVTACNAYEPMREALEKVMVGGNHLGLIIGVDHPPYTASHEEARAHYADAIWTYEAWCCWKTIMEARPALSTLHVNERHHSGSDNERLRKALSKIEVWADDRSHLNNVFETIAIEARAALNSTGRQTSDDAGRLRDDALANLKWEARFLLNRLSDLSFDDLDDLTRDFNGHVEPSISRLDRILSGMEARAALKGVPQPATNDYQADASAPALSETVSVRSEQKRRQKNMLTDLVDAVLYLNDIVGDLDETGKTSSTRLGHLQRAVDRLLESISSADTGAKLNFSNDAERDGVSLKSDTSLQPASEAGKLSTKDHTDD